MTNPKLSSQPAKTFKTEYQLPPAASESSKSEKDLLLFLLSIWHFEICPVLRSKEKISRISVIFAFAGVVGSERKISLPRRLPKSFPVLQKRKEI